MNHRCFILARAVAVAIPVFPVVAQACAVCLTGASADDPTANAFNWSVMFLIMMPYTVVGSIAGWLFYSHWRAAKNHEGLKRRGPVLRVAWINKGSGR
jgi:heme/copper-type cytochrome/quinol oxidase subunit 2